MINIKTKVTTQTKSTISRKTVKPKKRIHFTFLEEDKIMKLLAELEEIYEGLDQVEIIKLGLSKLKREEVKTQHSAEIETAYINSNPQWIAQIHEADMRVSNGEYVTHEELMATLLED